MNTVFWFGGEDVGFAYLKELGINSEILVVGLKLEKNIYFQEPST